MRSTVLLLALLVARPSGVASQLPSWVRPGARLRVTTRDSAPPLVGVLVGSGPTSFAIIPDYRSDTVSLGLDATSRIEVSREPGTYAGKGALIGGLVGSGAVLLVIAASNDDVPPNALGTLLLCVASGGAGAGLGGEIGSGFARDAWEPIGPESARLRIAPSRHGMSIGVSLRL